MSYSNVKITRSVLSNNGGYRYTSGGAIYARYSNFTLESSRLSNNYAYYSGGAIYMDNVNGNFELQIIDSILNGNIAVTGSGGAIYMYNVNGNFELQIIDSILNENTAGTGSGGAIYIYVYRNSHQVDPVSYQL